MSADTDLRLKELVTKIGKEQDPRVFSALVEELNRLLDGGKWFQSHPATTPEPTSIDHKNALAMPGSAAS